MCVRNIIGHLGPHWAKVYIFTNRSSRPTCFRLSEIIAAAAAAKITFEWFLSCMQPYVSIRLAADGCSRHFSAERTQVGYIRRAVFARIRGLCTWNFVRTAYGYVRPLPCAQFTRMPVITTHWPWPIRIQRYRKMHLTPNSHLPTSTFADTRERNHSTRCVQVSHH